MKNIIKHLWLVITLILATSLILLMSHRPQRFTHENPGAQAYPSIAVMQITSTSLLDSFVTGMISRLEEKGYCAPDGNNIRLYNPQGDYGTANAIAVNTSEVSDAARSLTARNVDAVWIGGDTVAMASIGLIISLAQKAGIPVFTNDPMDAEKGALFGLGADYHTVGQYTADMAVAILDGQPPQDMS